VLADALERAREERGDLRDLVPVVRAALRLVVELRAK
jgi:hypothetical protein